jgi:hypothetical protein
VHTSGSRARTRIPLAFPKPRRKPLSAHRARKAEKANQDKSQGWLQWLSPYLGRHKGVLLWSLAAATLWTAALISAPLIQKVVVDDAIVERSKRSPAHAGVTRAAGSASMC